jgi:hypothetical protein
LGTQAGRQYSPQHLSRHIRVWFPRIAASLLIAMALGWGWTFGFTDFRAHQRLPMLVIAAVTLACALLLWARILWIVLSSIVLSLLGAVAAIYIQVHGGFFNRFLIVVALMSLCYSVGLGWALKANRWKVLD